MELPIFNDNLKSSGSWTAALAQAQAHWPGLNEEIRAAQWANAGPALDPNRFRAAAEQLSAWAAEPEAAFSLARLLSLHRLLSGAAAADDVLRKTEPLPMNALHDPTPAILLPRMLDNAFDWFGTDSFRELHAVEQASVVYLRLLDLHPFPTHTAATALLAASFYTERAGLPPLILFGDDTTRARFAQALEAAFRMLTQPLVELLAESLTRAMQLGKSA